MLVAHRLLLLGQVQPRSLLGLHHLALGLVLKYVLELGYGPACLEGPFESPFSFLYLPTVLFFLVLLVHHFCLDDLVLDGLLHLLLFALVDGHALSPC